MAFADTRRADQQDIFGPVEETSGGQIMDLTTVDRGVEAEVEAVEAAFFAEVGGLGAALDLALLAHVELVLEEQFEELKVVELVAAGLGQS